MALNINTNITNNLDGYLLDAKNVKGGFVVVEDWSDVENLPSSTKVTGSLIYVVGDTLGGGANVGFYQCDAIGNWQKRVLGGSGIYQFSSQSADNIDYSQTYIYTLTSSQQTGIGNDFAKLVDADTTTLPMLIFAFNDTNLLIAMSNLAMGNSGILSHTIIEQNNTQYIVNINIALDFSTITLSFSELQAGSGGGSEGSGEKIYTYKMEWDSVDVGVGQTNILTFSVNENTIKGLPSVYQNLIDASDLVSAWNTIKTGISGGSQSAFYQGLIFISMLSSFTFDKSLIEFDDNIDGSMKNITAITVVLGNDQTLEFSFNSNSDSVNHYSMSLNDFFASTITLLGSVGGASNGGSSEVGGSGKLYELNMQLTRYDENGDQVGFGSLQGEELGLLYTHNQDYTLDLTLDIYESNFEKIKTKLNALIDLVNQQTGGSIPHLTDINSLVSFINSTLNESVADGDTVGFILLNEIIPLCDNAYYTDASTTPTPHKYNIIGVNLLSWTIGYYLNNDLNGVKIMFSVNDDDRYYALNANNSCTLTEYGTSGSGGGTSATRTKYHIEVADSNGNKAIIPIYQDTFEDYLVEFNQVGQTMATAMSITWTTINNIAEFKTLFDTQKSTQLAYGCDLGMNLLVKYAYESGENPVLKLFLNTTPDTYIDFAVSSLVDYNLANNLLGAVRSIELQDVATGTPDENYNYWFKPRASSNYPVIITIDQDATFTYTEEQVAGGNSSGGEVATKKWYEWKFADGMLTSNEIIFKLNENNFTFIVGRINAMMKQQDPTWQDISTSQEVVALYDQLKLLNDSTTIFALAYFLYNGALDSDTIPYFYRDQWQKREILNSDMYVAGTTSTQNATPYCFLIVDVNDNHTYEYVNLNASSTLVITETEETIGGGGGNTSSEEWYKWELKGTYASMSSTYNTFISYINETQMQEIYTAINTALSTSISTPQELINIYDISKADDLSQSMNFYLLSQMFSVVANYSYKNGKQVYLEDGDDGGIITPCQINILQGFANIYSIVVNSSSPTEWFVNNVTDATNGIHIAFDSASTLTITKL